MYVSLIFISVFAVMFEAFGFMRLTRAADTYLSYLASTRSP